MQNSVKTLLPLLLFCKLLSAHQREIDTTRFFSRADAVLASADTSNGLYTFDQLTWPFTFDLAKYTYWDSKEHSLHDTCFIKTQNGWKAPTGLCKPSKNDSVQRYVYFENGKIKWGIFIDPENGDVTKRVFLNDTSVYYSYYHSGQVHCKAIDLNLSCTFFYEFWHWRGWLETRMFSPTGIYEKENQQSWYENGRLESITTYRFGKSKTKRWNSNGMLVGKSSKRETNRKSTNNERRWDDSGKLEAHWVEHVHRFIRINDKWYGWTAEMKFKEKGKTKLQIGIHRLRKKK